MPVGYEELLEATIQHLEELKGRGVRFVSASPGTLTQLARPRTPKSEFAARKPGGREQKPAPKAFGVQVRDQIRETPKFPKAAAPVAQPLGLALPGQKIVNPSAPALTPEAKVTAFADLRQQIGRASCR